MARNVTIHGSSKPYSEKKSFMGRVFLEQKLDNWIGYLIFAALAVGFGWATAKQPLAGIGVIGAFAAIIVFVICLTNTLVGIYILAAYAFFINFFSLLLFNGTFPIGIGNDLLILCIFLGLFIKKINWAQSINQFTRSQIGLWMLVLFMYLFIELFNPNARSFDGWYLAFRKILGSLLLLFISFNVFTSMSAVKKYLAYMFWLCVIAGAYGCVQQFHGFFGFEINFVLQLTPEYTADTITSTYRKMSTFTDCSAFGMLMAAAAVFYTLVAFGQKDKKLRGVIMVGVLIMLMGMGFSGTRTANAMLIAGFFMYSMLTINQKSTQRFALAAVLLLLFILYAPFYNNLTINRFRTTFETKKDASYQVRETNRTFIQPYIHTHPIGGGLATTGAIGHVMNPGHYLAGFSPDGSYLMKALETGWVGLIIALVLYFVVMLRGINGYFKAKRREVRLIFSATTSVMFAFYVGEYAQIAIGQITDIVFYYPLIAILLRAGEFEKAPEQQLS